MRRDETWRRELQTKVSGEIRFDEPADRHTSMGVGGKIDALVFPKNPEELLEAVAFLKANHIPFLPVGNWTNFYNAAYIQGGVVIQDQDWIDVGMGNTKHNIANGIGAASIRAWIGSGIKAWPRECMGRSGVIFAVSPWS